MAPQKRKRAKPKNAINTIDVWGCPVHCTSDQWNGHIIDPIEGHVEMIGREVDVARAIQDPDVVRPSTKTGLAFAFETVSTSETVRVFVYYDNPTLMRAGRTRGRVATAYVDTPDYTSQVGAPIYTKAKTKTGTK